MGYCRWDIEQITALATTARFGAYLPAADSFDAAMFSLSMAEAMLMDPQQRLLLEAATESLTTHFDVASATSNGRTAVYIGIAPSDYSSLAKTAESGPYHATANAVRYVALCYVAEAAMHTCIILLWYR